MTAVSREKSPELRTNQAKMLIVALALGIGVGVGLGLAQMLDLEGSDATASYEGPMVERSLAMQGNLNTIIDGGNAQLAARAAASRVNTTGNNLQRPRTVEPPTSDRSGASHSPMVERSLAMEQKHAALIAGGLAQSKYLD